MGYVGLVLFVLTITAPLTTGMVTVSNPGLEDLVLSDPGDFALGNIPDWVISGQGKSSTLRPGTSKFTGGSPQVTNFTACSHDAGGGIVSKVLSATLQADTAYTLMDNVGQRLDFPLSSYTVASIANGVTLVPDSSLNSAPDTSHTDTIINDSGSDSAQLAQNLEIQLSASTGRRADFDNVLPKASLTKPIPEPSSLDLLVIGLVCLLLYLGQRCANRGFYQCADVKLRD